MYRRSYQFPTPYYYHPSNQGNVYYNYSPKNQYYDAPPHQQVPYNDLPPYLTPFEQFKKPDQPVNWQSVTQTNPNYYSTNQNSQTNFMYYFYDENGQIDIDKMLSTVGQVANTVQQVSPVIKQVSSLIKAFK